MGRPESIVKVRVLGEGVVLGIDGVVQGRVGYMDLIGSDSEGSRVCLRESRYVVMMAS